MKLAIPSKRMTSGFEELLGHRCLSKQDFQDYLEIMPSAKLVDDDFDFGAYNGYVEPAPEPIKLSETTRARLQAIIDGSKSRHPRT